MRRFLFLVIILVVLYHTCNGIAKRVLLRLSRDRKPVKMPDRESACQAPSAEITLKKCPPVGKPDAERLQDRVQITHEVMNGLIEISDVLVRPRLHDAAFHRGKGEHGERIHLVPGSEPVGCGL